MFFDQLMFSCAARPVCHAARSRPRPGKRPSTGPRCPPSPKSGDKDVVIVTNCAPDDENLAEHDRRFPRRPAL